MLIRLLLAVDDRDLQRRFGRLLDQPDLVVTTVGVPELEQALAAQSYDLVMLAEPMPREVEALRARLRRLGDGPDIVVLRRREDAGVRARLLAAGCLAVLNPSLSDPELVDALAAILRRRRELALTRLRAGQARAAASLSEQSSASPAMQRLLRRARRVAGFDSSLLLLGETGVGKEWLARGIHEAGARRDEAFFAVNCAAVPETLLETELFGHEQGAFTGASRGRRGCFELAHQGTLFLDEIGEMAPPLQAKLLRALQERLIWRLGSERPIEVDVRVMAATSRDLATALSDRSFRQDLYYRLAVVTLTVPPLRERREDIPPLVMSYFDRFRQRLGASPSTIAPEAMEALLGYGWPGNVRELINVVERSVLLCEGPQVSLADLREGIGETVAAAPGKVATSVADELGSADGWLGEPLGVVRRQVVEELERRYLEAQLRAHRGRIGEVARRAGLDPRSLHRKMRQYGLRKESFRSFPAVAPPRSGVVDTH